MNRKACLGLGSNMGDRLRNIIDGLAALDDHPDVAVGRLSTIIETEPVDAEGHAPYLNGVAQVTTTLAPHDLLAACLDIERSFGRVRDGQGRHDPRRLDIDLLLLGDEIIDEPGLRVPHPRMHERAFVLVPLVELDPDLVHPTLCRSMRALLEDEIRSKGPLEGRCAILRPGPLLGNEPLTGPAGLASD